MEKSSSSRLEQELVRKIQGEVLFDDMSRALYSTDASLYQIWPLGVVLPRSREDIVQAVRTAAKHRVHLLPRGGGTSLAGQTVSSGLVVDYSKYLNQVLELNPSRRWARVQPGIVLDNLNHELKPYGLQFAPDVATSSRANIGGMIGNNSSGIRSVRYGKTVDHVLELSVMLSTGEELRLHNLNALELDGKRAQENREGEIYRSVSQIVDENRKEIIKRYPRVMRRVGGYNLDYLLDPNEFNLARLIVGSEGTLAFVTEAKLNLEPLPAVRATCVVHFSNLIEAMESVPVILEQTPSAVEILDQHSLELAYGNPVISGVCADFIRGKPQAILMVEFSGVSRESLHPRIAAMQAKLKGGFKSCYASHDIWQEEEQEMIWKVRKHALGILLGIKGDDKPLPFVEDSCVPVECLGQYISRVVAICRRYQRRVALYAHASVGVIHVRPILNLKKKEDVEIMRCISEEVFELVEKYGGAWSGEHGDGLVRSYKNRNFFGEPLYQAFRRIKQVFDPLGLMNPGKIIEAQDLTENLRIDPQYVTRFPPTHFGFQEESGFDRAIEMCTGVGHCRKTLTGTMCPSYMATREEQHTTRGRANALREAMAGRLGPDALTSPQLYHVMDLCLECKACKSECPSNVDMAKLKYEFLAHYYARHGLPVRKRLLSATRQTGSWGSRFARLTNFTLQSHPARWFLDQFMGIDRRRVLPLYAHQRFSQWYASTRACDGAQLTSNSVALFLDTFVDFYEPEIGRAATRLLETLGYRVVLADAGCCGRPLISTGRLAQAKRRGALLVKRLLVYVQQEIPILVLEPSCLSALRDDYLDLLDDRDSCRKVAQHIFSLDEFLSKDEAWRRLSARIGDGPKQVLLHSHCQQKALIGTESSLKVLKSLQKTRVSEIDSGCCGMAGAFGYEKEHYDLSEKIGSQRLFPAIKTASVDTEIVASGFSCRHQICHFTGRRARHLVDLLAQHLIV